MMNICFVGLGSIAGRHIRNLRELLGDRVGITVLRSGVGAAGRRGGPAPHFSGMRNIDAI